MPITLHKSHPILPVTAQLLTMGGDGRIACNPATGTNKYHCAPTADPSILPFGSATASTISPAAFAAADTLRQRLDNATASYTREMEHIRYELQHLLGLTDTDIIFASSGTDLHLFAAQMTAPDVILMMEAAETGSGVPKAISGRHFSGTTVTGESVVAGAAVDGAILPEIMTVTCRSKDGSVRPSEDIDSEFAALAAEAMTKGRKLLVILTDVSKTGLLMPGPACVASIHASNPAQVDVLVDACQFRLSAATLRRYLEHGFLVAVTGSKFISGPAFSGALFVPGSTAARLRPRILPQALGQYSSSADWPAGWAMRATLPDTANYGLLLRWQAALTEMQRFYALPESAIRLFLERFAATIYARLDNDPTLAALPTPAPDRSPFIPEKNWDNIPTIFPFLLRHENGTWLSRNETEALYKRLKHECHIEVGQPVLCGAKDGIPVSALRLCLSARLIAQALADGKDITADALSVLDKATEFTAQI